MWDEPRSPNVAIKWDKVPLQISAKSSITSKVKRDDSHYTWNEYKIEVTERFHGSTRRDCYGYELVNTYQNTQIK